MEGCSGVLLGEIISRPTMIKYWGLGVHCPAALYRLGCARTLAQVCGLRSQKGATRVSLSTLLSPLLRYGPWRASQGIGYLLVCLALGL